MPIDLSAIVRHRIVLVLLFALLEPAQAGCPGEPIGTSAVAANRPRK